jgi:phosphate acetyltransferase
MARSLYVAAAEAESGKSAIALGVLDLLARQVQRVGIFAPSCGRWTRPTR